MKVNKPTVITVEFDEDDVNCIRNAYSMVADIIGVINDEDADGLCDNYEGGYFSHESLNELRDKLSHLYNMLKLGELDIE